MSQYASYYKESLFIRLDWEITTPELPEHIRVKLKEAKTYLEQITPNAGRLMLIGVGIAAFYPSS